MRSFIYVMAACIAVAPLLAGAQDDDSKAAELSGPAVFDPAITSAASLPQPALVFRASTEEQSASLRIGKVLGNTPLGDFSIGATLSGPLSKEAGSATLASLDGLAGATSVGVQASLFAWAPKPVDPKQAKSICQKHLGKDSCTRQGLPTAAAKDEWDALVDYGHPWLLNSEFRIGRQSFNFIDLATLTTGEEDRTPFSVRLGTGFVQPGLGYIGVSYRHERSYQGGDQTQVCTSLGSADALRCDTVNLGAPRLTPSNIGSVEARLFGKYIAVNPRASYDFSNDVLGLELPVYFAQNGDSGFTGGINIGWRSDIDRVTAVLFVGAALDLFPQ